MEQIEGAVGRVLHAVKPEENPDVSVLSNTNYYQIHNYEINDNKIYNYNINYYHYFNYNIKYYYYNYYYDFKFYSF